MISCAVWLCRKLCTMSSEVLEVLVKIYMFLISLRTLFLLSCPEITLVIFDVNTLLIWCLII